MWHTSLGLILTDKCNAECRICCFKCSPRGEKRMPLNVAIDLVEQASKIPSIKTIGISGGEPFLYFEDIVKILSTCKKHSLSATCTTNGFWGLTKEIAMQKLSILKNLGVNYITLSVDYFHSKYIEKENIRNVLNGAKDVGIGVVINTVSTKKSRGLEYIVKELGYEILNCNIIEIPCAPIGNAADRIDNEDLIISNSIPDRRCQNIRTLSVTPDGNVYSCCSECGFTNSLCQGNIKDNSLKELINNFFNNEFCYALSMNGVEWIKRVIIENNLPIKLKDKYVSACHLCNDIFKNDENINSLKPFIKITK